MNDFIIIKVLMALLFAGLIGLNIKLSNLHDQIKDMDDRLSTQMEGIKDKLDGALSKRMEETNRKLDIVAERRKNEE